MSVADVAAPSIPGRIDVSARALESTVRAVAAGHLGVPAREVRVTLSDVRGLLGIAIVAALAVPPLRAQGDALGIPSRIARARERIEQDVLDVAGTRVGRVSVEIARVIIEQPRRVA